MTSKLTTITKRIRSLRGVAPDARWPATKSVALRQAKTMRKTITRRILTGQIRIVQTFFGPAAANRFFWSSPLKDQSWFNVQRRIDYLTKHHPDQVRHFVLATIRHTTEPVTIAGLARHPYSREALRGWMTQNMLGKSPELTDRLRANRLLGGAFAGAANLLLAPDDAPATSDWVLSLYQVADSRLLQFIDSMSWHPSPVGEPLAVRPSSGRSDQPARHRLIIADHFDDPQSFALLLPGATKTTLVATAETFGKADFSEYGRWPGVGEISVEHIRSRVTRFSQEYIDLHEATTKLADQLAARVGAIPDLLHPHDRASLAVEIADYLFFQALRIRAVEVLLKDSDFDHVVLALGEHQPTAWFIRSMAGVTGLMDDPRLEIVSTSRSAAIRLKFWDVIDGLLDSTPLPLPNVRRIPDSLVLRTFDAEAHRLADMLPKVSTGPQPDVFVVTTNNQAYNQSTAAYAHELRQGYDVQIVHMGRDATDLVQFSNDLADGQREIPIWFLFPSPEHLATTTDLLSARLSTEASELTPVSAAEHAAAWALHHGIQQLARNAIAPALVRVKALEYWLAAAHRENKLPDAIVLTPHRNPAVGCVASIARRFGVPTIALEPHVQDSNYCRYMKVSADYYGVVSDYFRDHAPVGFGIGIDRTVSIGSPRQIAPDDPNPELTQSAARRAFERNHDFVFDEDTTYLVFFCQPSDWAHVTRVWANILDAAREHQCCVLLKTHPEESVSRDRLYLDQATLQNAGDRVLLLDCDAATAVALGDIALTAYSTAAIDAAIRKKPVVCVTDGDIQYPLDLASIVGGSLVRSASELSELIADFRSAPERFQRQARSLVEREPQFLDGPGPRLRALVSKAIESGHLGIRDPSSLSGSLFLDGPHRTYSV